MDIQLPPRYELDVARPILGEGGMGRVLKVRDTVLDVPVALKVVRPDLAADERFRKLFDLEVRTSARFTHPHIVPLHDLGELGDGTPFLGLAFADGGSFANLKDAPPPWPELLRLMLELLDALAHLHALDVLHRDLKPENVLLYRGPDGEAHVWLADLGLANAGSQLAKKKGRSEGTPGFWAPEQKLGMPREYGPWTDLYSLGVVLWVMVTGSLPFPEGRSAIEADLPSLIPQQGLAIPDGLDLVLSNLLAAEPMSRYDLCADLRAELRALGEPTITRVSIESGVTPAPSNTRIGTVAPSFGSSSSLETDEDGAVQFQYGVPIWNRPIPAPFPAVPPPEPGLGATARGSVGLFALRELPLVARDDYRQLLWDQAREVLETLEPRVVLIVGETGCGKTRLVESIVRTLHEGGWAAPITLTYQDPPGKEDGYAGAARALVKPWRETRPSLEARLRRRLARVRGAVDDQVKEAASALARWSGLLDEGEEPVAAGYGLREVHRTLDTRSWRGLSVLVLDSAQWASEEGDGLAIAEAVAQAAVDGKKRPLLVLATLRAESLAKSRTLNAQVHAMVEAGALRVDLPRLDRAGTEALLAESLNLTPDIADKVASRCEGNPLFARQLLVEWANRGWLEDKGDLQFGLIAGVDVQSALPADAEALFRDRVQALAQAAPRPDRFLDVVHMAALAGVSIPDALLEVLSGTDLFDFVRGSGLWVKRQEALQFDHGALADVVRAQAQARPDLDQLHRRLARAWGRYGQHVGVDVSYEVGRHAYAGGDYRLAVRNLLVAAEGAWQRGRTKELAETAAWAVECCHAAPRFAVHGGRAKYWRAMAFQARGESQLAGRWFAEASEMFEAQGDDVGLVESRIGEGWAERKLGDLDGAARLYTDAMNRARASEQTRLEARAIAGMAWVEQEKRNFEGADILFTRVLNRFGQLGDQRGMAEAALGQAFVARRTGNFDEALELYEEAEESFMEGDDLLGVARAMVGRAMTLRQLLRLEEATELLQQTLQLAEELGAASLLMESRLVLAEIDRLRGDHERARATYMSHGRWAARQGLFEAVIETHLGLAHLAMSEGDLNAMYEHANHAVKSLNRNPGHWLWAPYRLVVAALLALRGDEEQTYRWLWSAAELGLGDAVDHDLAEALSVICDVAADKRWANVMRVAGKLAHEQWRKLGRPEEAQRVLGQVEAVLKG